MKKDLKKILINAELNEDAQQLRSEGDILFSFASLMEAIDRVFCVKKDNMPMYYQDRKISASERKRLSGIAKTQLEAVRKKLEELEKEEK